MSGRFSADSYDAAKVSAASSPGVAPHLNLGRDGSVVGPRFSLWRPFVAAKQSEQTWRICVGPAVPHFIPAGAKPSPGLHLLSTNHFRRLHPIPANSPKSA